MAEGDQERRENYPHSLRIQTRWIDNDVYGHVNNVVHYSWFDTAVSGWLLEQGLIEPHRSEQIGLVVETGCRYFAEISFPDTVTAGIRVAKLGTSSVRYEIGLFRRHDEEPAATGHFVHVWVDRRSQRPVAVPQQIRAALLPLLVAS